MQETLYKIASPQHSPSDSEGKELHLSTRVGDGKSLFYVEQFHGWWNASQGRYIHEQLVLSSEGFRTFEEAYVLYNQQKMSLARQGFLHSFSKNPGGIDDRYELIALE